MEDKDIRNNEEKMMDDEYMREFSGCAWMFIAAIIGIGIIGSVILFT